MRNKYTYFRKIRSEILTRDTSLKNIFRNRIFLLINMYDERNKFI